jgi:hypothetical protein
MKQNKNKGEEPTGVVRGKERVVWGIKMIKVHYMHI